MATDLGPRIKPPPTKYESFVDQQIARVRGRVRSQDAGRALLLFAIVTLAYALAMALADRAWTFPTAVRLSAVAAYGVAGAVLLGWAGLCLFRRVNPYYAARQLEQTLPDAKNSLMNWLDLRDRGLPPVIHSALGLRAARDLKKADPEQAVSAGPMWLLGGILGALLLALMTLFIMGPQQFGSLMQRAFTPFRERGIETRTSIAVIDPEGGNATVLPSRAITFRARIDGPVPAINHEGAPQILWRYSAADPFVNQPLEKDADENWSWVMPADQVINGGLSYKVTAGDAETPEYQVTVAVIPQVRSFQVGYRYRPYLHLPAQKKTYPKVLFSGLRGDRGTEVSLQIRANCELRSGRLSITWLGDRNRQDDWPAAIDANDPSAMRFPKIILDRPGFFSVVFISKEGKPNSDQASYPIEIFSDKAPAVVIDKPGKEIQLPSDGTLNVEGSASDDHGVKSLTLHMKVSQGGSRPLLEPKPYRPGKSFKLDNGTYPDHLQYKDLVALERVKTAQGEPFTLTKGMEIEYWLEAIDNSDYPDKDGQRGKSAIHKLKILDPEKNQKKRQQERQQAQKQQKEHDQQQDQDLDRQNEAAKKDQAAQNNPDQKNQDDQLKSKQEETEKSAREIENKLKDQEKNGGQSQEKRNGTNEPDKGNPDKGNQETGGQPQTNNQEKNGKQPEPKDQPNPNDGKQANQPQTGSKEGKSESNAPQPKSKDDKQAGNGDKEKSQAKDGAKDGNNNQPGNAKDDSQKEKSKTPAEKNQAAQSKDGGKKNPDAGAEGAAKQDSAQGKEKSEAAAKGGPKDKSPQPKEKGGSGQKQISAGKEGPVDGKTEAHGLAKGQEHPGEKGVAADKKGKTPPPQAKNNGAAQEPSSKNLDPKQVPKTPRTNGNKSTDTPLNAKEPTLDDIARLQKQLKAGDPKGQRSAEKELSRICRDCKNPNVKTAAEEALRQAGKTPMTAADGSKTSADKTGQGKEKTAKTGAAGQATADEPGTKEGTPDGPGVDDPKQGGGDPGKGGNKAGSYGAGSGGYKDEGKAKDPNANFAKHGNSLTLDHWRKLLKATPKQRQDAGISDQQWQKFAQAVKDYERLLRKMQTESPAARSGNVRGANSILPNIGPSQVSPRGNRNVAPLDYSRSEAPPEFREAQRNFTRGKGPK